MQIHNENPAALAGGHRVLNIKALAGVDVQNLSEISPELQAINILMRRHRLPFWHAKVVAGLAGIGRAG